MVKSINGDKRLITHLTYSLAYEITSNRWELETFNKNAQRNEWISICHTNFFYSYPSWGKKWAGDKDCEFHRVETACNCCRAIPDRNYAGYGTLFIMKSNRPRRDFVLFCSSCAKWRNTAPLDIISINQPLQYQLF